MVLLLLLLRLVLALFDISSCPWRGVDRPMPATVGVLPMLCTQVSVAACLHSRRVRGVCVDVSLPPVCVAVEAVRGRPREASCTSTNAAGGTRTVS